MSVEKAPVLYKYEKVYRHTEDHYCTGDWVMTLWVDPKMNLKSRILVGGIKKTTGALHNHDEPILRKPDGLYVGYASPPHYTLVPWEKRIDEFNEGKRVFAVFRWHTFMKRSHAGWYEAFQDCAGASIKTLAALQVPYDNKAIDQILMLKIIKNIIRKTIHLKNTEHNVYCTEGGVLVYEVNGINMLAPLGHQQFPSPIHAEKLWRKGYLAMIADYGLRKYLLAE